MTTNAGGQTDDKQGQQQQQQQSLIGGANGDDKQGQQQGQQQQQQQENATPEQKAAAEAEKVYGKRPEGMNDDDWKKHTEKVDTDNKAHASLFGPPEGGKYEDFKMPEGSQLDAPVLEKVMPLFQELRLSQVGGQKLVDVYANTLLPIMHQRAVEAWGNKLSGWVKDVQTDKEIGGDNLKTTMGSCARAIGAYTKTPEEAQAVREALDITGAGNHPALVRFFNRVGASVSEDVIHRQGEGKNEQKKDHATALYGPGTEIK